MSALTLLLLFTVPGAVLAAQLARVLGRRVILPALVLVSLPAAGWLLLERAGRIDPNTIPDRSRVASVVSDSCLKCHPDHYESWRRTHHRTMTREATPEFVKGDFVDAVYEYRGTTTRMIRRGDEFFMETVDPKWAESQIRNPKSEIRNPKSEQQASDSGFRAWE